MYTDIIQFLNNKRLNEALTQLSAYIAGTDNWTLHSKWENLSSTYGFMKQYAAQGMDDPQRSKMFDNLIAQTYGLADETHLIVEARKRNSEFGKAIANNVNAAVSFQELSDIIELNDIDKQTQRYKEGQISADEINAIRKKNEEAIDKIFLKAWTSLLWNDSQMADAESLVHSLGHYTTAMGTFISGVTLNLLNLFDEKKFILLIKVYQFATNLAIGQRALVGLTLAVYFQKDRFAQHPNAVTALDSLKENAKAVSQMRDIQILFLQTRETEKANKKMREEIIPQMIKSTKLMDPKFKIENLEDLEDLNPEWEKGKEKFSDKLKEMSDLQIEGVDTNMGTFAQLKHYPFFKTAAHWFYPFDPNNSYVADIIDQDAGKKKSLFGMLLDTPMFCNSDKYSFYMTLTSLKNSGMDMINEEIFMQDHALKEESNFARYKKKEETPINIARQYIQDIYRFFKLWMFRSELSDIFKDRLTFWENTYLHSLIMKEDTQLQIANYLFNKEYMEEAAELYEDLRNHQTLEADTLQKLGYCYQKMKNYAKAIDAFKQADIIKSDNYWTLKHLAICYKRSEEYKEALNYYSKLLEQRPDNLNILLQTGQCLAILERFDEALNHFYKVEYLGKSTESAQRAIGWCQFMSGKYDKAIEIYRKVIENNEPIVNDWLNWGHAYIAKNNTTEAIRCYKEAERLCSTHDDFMKHYLADKNALLKQGIEENNIYIMADLI